MQLAIVFKEGSKMINRSINETAEFLNQVVSDGRFIEDVLLNPIQVAKALDIKVSNNVVDHINNIRLNITNTINPHLRTEIKEYVTKVINDGRYVPSMLVQPDVVSKELNIHLSSSSYDELRNIKLSDVLVEPDDLITLMGIGTISVMVAVGIGVVLGMNVESKSSVIDNSGIEKL